MEDSRRPGQNKIFNAVLRLNTKMLGLVLGLLFGFAIFYCNQLANIKGGHTTSSGEYVVGPHLALLSQFIIGYRVSFFWQYY